MDAVTNIQSVLYSEAVFFMPWERSCAQVSNYVLVTVVLINLLIASLNNTFAEIQVPSPTTLHMGM
jgi:hypothetical protein